jgi:hypothetical protein
MKRDPVTFLRGQRGLLRLVLLATGLSSAGALLTAFRTRRPELRLFFVLVAMLLAGEYIGVRRSVTRDPEERERGDANAS